MTPKKITLLILLGLLFKYSGAQVVGSESFNGATFPPAGWLNVQNNLTGLWDRVTAGTNPFQLPHSGTGEARFASYLYDSGTEASLITPAFDLSSIGANTAVVSFWMYRDNDYQTSADKIEVFIDTATNGTGTLLGTVNRCIILSPVVPANGWYEYSYIIPATFTSDTNYIIFKATSDYGNNMFIDDAVLQLIPVCIDPPVAGTAVSNYADVCAVTGEFIVSLSGNTNGISQTYQWQSSTDSTIWTNIAGATGATYTGTQADTSFYRAMVTCGTSTDSSAGVRINISPFYKCYCESKATGLFEVDDIANVSFGSLNNGSATPPTTYNPVALSGYSDFDMMPATQVYQGQIVPFSVTEFYRTNYSPSWVNIFIDLNQDGVFNPTNERVFTDNLNSFSPPTVSGFITIPAATPLGKTGMRVIVDRYGFSTSLPCGTYGIGETEDYVIEVVDTPASAPVCVNPLSISPEDLGVNVLLNGTLSWETVVSATGYKVYFDTVPTPMLVDTVLFSNYTPSSALLVNTTYYWQVVAMNDSGDASGCPVWSFTTGNQWNYCFSEAFYNFDNDIGNVKVMGLDNGNATPTTFNPFAENVYSNYDTIAATPLFRDRSTTIQVTQIWPDQNYGSWVNAFIDYNQDGDFNPVTERIFSGYSDDLSNPVSAAITVPATATLGMTRMRIIANEFGSSTDLPCGTYFSGETEDYTVNIVPPPAVDIAITKMLDPSSTGCTSAATDVIVRIKNEGSDAIDFSATDLTINGTISGAVSQGISITINTNALNGGLPLDPLDSLDVIIATIDMTTQGNYNFDFATIISGDGNIYNDNLLDQEVLVSSGTVAQDTVNVCDGISGVLSLSGYSGLVQWQKFNGTTWLNETGTGATTGTYTVTPSASGQYRALVCGLFPSDTIQVNVVVLTAPVAIGDTVCSGNTATLTSVGSNLLWYDQPSGGTVLDTGNTFITPVLTSPTTFYVGEVAQGGGSTSLTAPFTAGTGSNGNMFDITALKPITVTGFSGHADVGITNWEIWYRPGTYVGFTASNAGWTLLGSATGVASIGIGAATPIPISFSIPVEIGETFAFYVTTTPSSPNGVYYTNGTTVGSIFATDANLQIKEGSGGKYFDVNESPIKFNGVVHFNTSCEGPTTAVVALVNPLPVIDLGPDVSICPTCTFLLDAGAGFSDYVWQDASPAQTFMVLPGTTTETYYVTITDGNGCSSSDTITISRNVGMDEFNAGSAVSVQPNPSSGIFNVSYEGANLTDAMIEIRNAEGQVVYYNKEQKLLKGYHGQINLNNLAKGIYTMSIRSREQVIISKLVIQ